MELRKEILIEIGDFLARFWSGRRVQFVIDEREIGGSGSVRYRFIRVPPPENLPGDNFTKYRIWRWIVWHESMHQRFTPHDYNDGSLRGFFANVIEDYRIKVLGTAEFPGMLPETIFYYSFMLSFFNPSEYTEPKRRIIAFTTKLLSGAVPKGFEPYEAEVERAVRFVREELAKRNYQIEPGVMYFIVDKVMEMLGLVDEYLAQNYVSLAFPWYLSQKIVSVEELKENVEKVISSLKAELKEMQERGGEGLGEEAGEKSEGDIKELKGKKQKEVDKAVEQLKKEALEGSEIVKEEFERVVKRSRKLDIIEKELRKTVKRGEYDDIDGRLYIPRKLAVDPSTYYDRALINHLIAELRRLRKGWLEVRSREGDEVDVEEVIRRSPKPMIREERIKIGGLKVILLLDFSGSIGPYEDEYKKALIALAEALNAVGCKFAVFAFTQPHSNTNRSGVFLIKDFNEKWGVETARRLAQLRALGPTPLDEIYEFLRPYIEKWKPNIFITLTDGVPEDKFGFFKINSTREKIKEMKRLVKMVAIAIGRDVESATDLAKNLERLGYDRSIAVHNLMDIPRKILWLLGEEI